ncbi:MAG: protocatechuate 3,4-dioxygenase subunit beta [Acidimicrobiales bacterium]
MSLSPPRYLRPPAGTHPPLNSPEYRSTALRAPSQAPIRLEGGPSEISGPHLRLAAEADLTVGPGGEAVGQRIVVAGRVLDSSGAPLPDTLVEIWQANASGRYAHPRDQWPGSLDPNFTGAGRVMTDAEGNYRFLTVKPGAYPWGNHHNAWRPAHIHFSLLGVSFTQRLVTQMYFPDDPLFFQDPIFNSVPDPEARQRLVSRYDHSLSQPEWALGFRWDIVLRGMDATPFEDGSPHA